MTAVQHAVWFFDNGVGIFPVRTPGKDPVCDSWDDYKCTREQSARFKNYGVRLSASLGVLDTDNRDDELWVLQQIAHRVIPDTPFLVETARGFHRYYRLAGALPKFMYRDGHTLEFRNEGQYVVGPGSIHPGDRERGIPPGKKYQALYWSWCFADLPFFPADFLFDDRPPEMRGSADGQPFVLPEVVWEKERHETLHRLMRSLVANGVPLKGALEVCYAVNRERCRPVLDVEATDLEKFLTRAWKQKDRGDFVRRPKIGWDLAVALLKIGLTADITIAAVRSVTPAFDPEAACR